MVLPAALIAMVVLRSPCLIVTVPPCPFVSAKKGLQIHADLSACALCCTMAVVDRVSPAEGSLVWGLGKKSEWNEPCFACSRELGHDTPGSFLTR